MREHMKITNPKFWACLEEQHRSMNHFIYTLSGSIFVMAWAVSVFGR